MATRIHFIDCGQGNMVLMEAADGLVFLFDCNVTDANADCVVAYLKHVLGRRRITYFICTHRDADHMRGVNRIHRAIGIDQVWDCGLAGNNPSSPEGEEYMRLRRLVNRGGVLHTGETFVHGSTRLYILSAADDGLPNDCNAQSIVVKVEQIGNPLGSVILTGDSDVSTWRGILRRYTSAFLSSEILLASHHGSWSFFDVGQEGFYFRGHIAAINPAMTVVSVGANGHGHPDSEAVRMYEWHSRGSAEGRRVTRTDLDGTMRLQLHADFGWKLTTHQEQDVPVVLPPPRLQRYAGMSLGDILAGMERPPLPSVYPPLPTARDQAEALRDPLLEALIKHRLARLTRP